MKEPEPDYRAIWEEYSRVKQRYDRDYEESMARQRADLSSRGIKEGSEGWDAAMRTLENKQQERMQTLQGTQAYDILNTAYKSNVGFALAPLRLAEYGDDSQQTMVYANVDAMFGKGARREMERMIQPGQKTDMRQWTRKPVSMEQFYENQYGTPDISNEPMQTASGQTEAQQRATVRAKRGAAGGFSPWW